MLYILFVSYTHHCNASYFPSAPDSRRMSKFERMKLDLDRESTAKVDTIRQGEEGQSLVVPCTGGDKTSTGEGTDGENAEEKGEGEKTEEENKSKDEKNKEKKLWMDFEDFCKCFGYVHYLVCKVLFDGKNLIWILACGHKQQQ